MPLPLLDTAPKDFDFIVGDWQVHHRRLDARLAGCTEWTEFTGLCSTRKTLGGFGNLEDNILHLPSGEYRAVAIRSFCAESQAWSIWWLDGRSPAARLDPPVVGKFTGDVGLFYADDVLDDRPIKVRFIWTCTPGDAPRWEQAFSPDEGRTWETNWVMRFTRMDEART